MRNRTRGFTLIEMLVVIGIVVVLVALLVPAGAIAISTARNASMSLEIAQLQQAIETYKKEKGDYPPSFGEIDQNGVTLYGNPATRYSTVVEKHLRKCYPKITPQEKDYVYNQILLDANGNPKLSGDEALVFWLTLTVQDERNPFTGPSGNVKRYYDFKQERLRDLDGDGVPSYIAAYSKDTPFVYIDSRTYAMHRRSQFAVGNQVQAYAPDLPQPPLAANAQRYMNPTTFQIICAGQDGDFGNAADQYDANGQPIQPKQFKSGINYTDEDQDNLANFSEGKELGDHIP